MAAVHARVSPLILECALLDVDAVTPGEAFSVRVRARSEDGPVRLRAIDVSWHGIERLDPAWVKPGNAEARAPTAGAVLNPGERTIARSPAGAVAEDVVVTPGETVERVVRVRLPPGLPPTFRGAVARVTYFITCVAATADARPEAPDPPGAWERAHARVPLRVRAPDGPTPREEGTSRVEAANPVSDAFAPRTPTFGSSFWMHELASAAGGTRSEPPGVAANETTGDGGEKNGDARDYPRAAPSSPPSPYALGVKTSPRSDLGLNLGPESPGSPLAALRRNETIANGVPEKNGVPDAEDGDRNESEPFAFSVPTGFLIAVADATAPNGRWRLAKVTPEPPFPRASASRGVRGRMDFFDGDGDDDDETSPSGDATATERMRIETEKTRSSTSEVDEASDAADDEAFVRACRHARAPRVARVVASLETREAVDVAGAGLRAAGHDPSAVVAGEDHSVLTRRRVWCETSQVVADVSSASFHLSAPREAPPSFESARVALSWFLRVEFSVAAPRACSAARGARGAAENARGVPSSRRGGRGGRGAAARSRDDANDAPPYVSEWCVPLAMPSPPPNRSRRSATRRDETEPDPAAAETRGIGSADRGRSAAGVAPRPSDGSSLSGGDMARDSSLLALF